MPNIQQSEKEKEDAKFIKYVYPLCQIHIGDLAEELQNNIKRYMMENSINLNEVREQDEPIVFFALRNYAPALLKFFVDNGATLDLTDANGNNPLKVAEEVVKETLREYSKSTNLCLLAESAVDYLNAIETYSKAGYPL